VIARTGRHHVERGLAFGRAGRRGQARVDHQSVPVLHQDMPQIGQLVRLARLRFWQTLLSLRAAGAVKPRKVAKYEDDLAAMTFEDARIARRDNEVGRAAARAVGHRNRVRQDMPNLPRIRSG
jgi:hypothetical protein